MCADRGTTVNGNELQIAADGSLVIPAEVLTALGWQAGGQVTFEISGAGIRLERARPGLMPQDQRSDLHATMEMSRDQIKALTEEKLRNGK